MKPKGDAGSDGRGSEEALSSLFHVLKPERRRQVIEILRRDGECSVRELAKEIAAVEYGVDVEALSNDEYRNVYNSLYQMHLPTLDDEGVVVYDQDRKVVEPDDGLLLAHLVYRLAGVPTGYDELSD